MAKGFPKGTVHQTTLEILTRLALGASFRQIVADLGVSYNTVAGVRDRLRKGEYEGLVVPTLRSDTEPPSPSMIRLAAFDPVVARALRQRLGQAAADEEEEEEA